MKHIYLTAMTVMISAAALAQGVLPAAPTKATELRRVEASTENNVYNVEREVIWSNDCNIDNCASDWVFDNGADLVGQPWEEIDINFECSLEGPAGPYNQWAGGTGDFTAASPMNSTTVDNGLIILDSDLFGADANYDAAWIENAWFQTANSIDCSAYDFVSMSFETRYRCWDNGASDDSEKCLVEVSRDGINWPDVSTVSEADGWVIYDTDTVMSRWEVFPGYETSDQTDNPGIVELDITSAAGGQDMVYVRFRWVGTWGYSWEIDDISIYETPANDIRIDNYVSYTDYNTSGIYEYGVFGAGQLETIDAAAKVYNVGYEPQPGTSLSVDLNGDNQGASDAIELGYGANDTLRVAVTLGDAGDYVVDYSVSSDNMDENEANNTASQSFSVSDLHIGRDNGVMTGLFPGEGTDDFIACNPMQIFEDVTIYAVDVAIADGSEEGTPVIAHLFDGADENFLVEQYGGLLVSSDELDLASAYSNTGEETPDGITWYTLVLEEPYTAAAGDLIGVGFEHYGGSNVQIWESKFTYDQTSFVYGPFGTGGTYDWYFTNEVPMVRLNLDADAMNTVNVEDIAGEAFQLFPCVPNPATASARMTYRLDQAAEISFEVRDMTGKLVVAEDRGTQSAGDHNLILDVSAFEAGVYTFSLNVDGARATQRIIVQ